ncbi:MAG: autotransporter-associated beta strand repeat-containing protein [Thermoguttaceae bacterium]|nr:autotransporter-associated beta strand repeat-containing protein [Thermoguttaceae bacterium]
MKTTRTTVFLSLAFLASFLFASSAFADITYTTAPAGDLVTGTGEGGVGNVTFNITGTNPVSYSGKMSGSGAITKIGNGELVLSGDSSEYTGLVNVNTGALTLTDEATLKGSVSINNESIFKCGAVTPQISNLTVNGGTFTVGMTSDTYEVYLSDFTLSSGFIEFDINDFDSSATAFELDKDYLYINNGTFNNGAISLIFNGNEMAWHDGAPNEGYPLIIASQNLEFQDDAIKIYADGQQTDNWYLSKDGKYVYLKPKSSQPDPPSPTDPWYYANSPTDLSASSWTMNKNPKIGVKFLEGNSMTAEFGSADDPKTITMTQNGDFTTGEYQIGDGRTLTIYATISGNANLKKTGAGTLILYGNNDYTGETLVTQGKLTLGTASTGGAGTLKPGSVITVDGSLDGTATLSGQGDVFAWGGNSPSKISLINGGTLLNDSTDSHITMGAVIEMNNGIVAAADGAVGTGGVGSYIMDNAIHVIGGQNNAINVSEFSIRHLDGTPYPTGEDAGYFDIAEGAKLTINAKMDNYSAATNVPVVKTGKGVLELTNRNGNIKSDFIIKEGTVIGVAPNDGSSAFGYGTLIIENGALLECREANQFGYGDTVQPNITIRGTLKSHMYTHVHNLNLESGTIEDIDPAQAGQGEGLMFYNREASITSSGTSVIKPKMTTDGTLAINVTDGELTISGNITGSAPITKSGAGKLVLPNANSKTGSVSIQNGEVVAGNALSLGTGALTIGGTENAVGQLTIGATSTDILDLTVSGLVTVDGGQINFDFTANDFDTLVAQNGFTFTTGKFNLNFAQGTEATWFENVPDEGYKLVSITGTYTGDENLSAYLSGRTEAWTLTAKTDGIYLGKSEEPSSLYWNPITDDGQNWPIDGTNKIGVKYTEDDVKTASHDENITLDSDGVFIIGDEYAFEQVGPISGDGDLTKTEGGKLTLSGDNTYTGDTIVSGGTLELNKDNAIATSGNVTNNATIESTGDQKLNNLSGTNKDAEINAENGTLTLNNDANANTRYDGTINGSASVRKIGVGSLMMTGENTYEGGTNIEEGEVVLLTDNEVDGTLGVGPIEIGQNGELVYNVEAGQTKKIENKITGAGTITKIGAGTLQAHGTDDMPLQAGSFNVEQGRLDLKGEFEGDVNVGPLDDNGNEVAAILSPGNSVGDVTIYGDVTIDAGATGLFEFSQYNNDPLLRSFDTLTIAGNDNTFTISDDAIVKLSFLNNDAYAWAEEGNEYQLVNDPGFADGDYSHLLSGYDNLFQLLGKNGNGLYLVGLGAPENPGVPEPSTWALLLLGAAGLYWMRRRK